MDWNYLYDNETGLFVGYECKHCGQKYFGEEPPEECAICGQHYDQQ